ncbi:diguanylate cyclase [Herbaspirillum sp. RTI4]|uniref:sensor domain-containing protein n=1 Tax=Herbaspirillum sp. RTI4 TaxID=3048640 RepID=UPI002AB5D6B2|nr:diguanylate cyclase [Herbaspirillum sp. RTI4]MDY7580035.1 diguanylate cyclase [Herbaspirillum sp. RTI4]MEA9982982.1 diguanylate cyclase [Herbaspirillum sp. RTI4]
MDINELPCAVLVTDETGQVLMANHGLLAMVGLSAEQVLQAPMESLFPLGSRLFLQTHVWPMLLKDGSVRELHLKISNAEHTRIPVMVNCNTRVLDGISSYIWVLFVAEERSKFEAALLVALNRAESISAELAEKQQFVTTVTDNMPGLVAYWDKDTHCRFANKPYLEWFGKKSDEMVGISMLALLGERLMALNQPYVSSVLRGEKQIFERTLIKPNGDICHTLCSYIPDFDSQRHVVGFFVLVTDVTPIKNAELELKLAASVFESTVEGIMVTDGNGIILSVNPAFTAITGYAASDVLGQTPAMLNSNRHDEQFHTAIWRELIVSGHWEGEIWNRRKDGTIFWQRQSVTLIRGATDEPLRYVTIFNDITELWEKDERMRHLAFHDALTGLPNRLLLMERLNQLLQKIEREPRNVAVMFLDLDGFKPINDQYGHEVGDKLLMEVARRLQLEVRQTDTVARLGGDEFIILLDNPADQKEVAEIVSRIIQSINAPWQCGEASITVGISVGIAMSVNFGDTSSQLMKRADAAMYAAKTTGKNTWRFSADVEVPK